MVFRGVTVDLLWGNTTIKQETERDSGEDDISVLPHMRAGTGTSSIASGYPAIAIQEELAGAVEGKKIKIEVTVPDLDRMELGLRLTTGEDADGAELFDYLYKKERAEGSLEAVSAGMLSISNDSAGVVTEKDGMYKVAIEKSFSSQRLAEFVVLEVGFTEFSGVANERKDSFMLRFL